MSQRQRPLEALKFAHSMTRALLTDFPEGKACHQSCPTDNHLLWSIGHLAATYAWMLGLLGQKAGVPEGYLSKFGWGSKPSPDAKTYPTVGEATKVMEAEYESFLRAVEGLSEAQLSQPLAQDVGKFAANPIELVDRASWHEGWHSGQISSVRRSLGLKSIMG